MSRGGGSGGGGGGGGGELPVVTGDCLAAGAPRTTFREQQQKCVGTRQSDRTAGTQPTGDSKIT